MATEPEYAELSNRVYNRTRENRTPIPAGWDEQAWMPDLAVSGFSAGVYKQGNEIVIAYTGTNEGKAADFLLANIPLGRGATSVQVIDAMLLYFAVKNDPRNAGATISFTGHSLGGGLASMMAVFFNKEATIFDAAPFELGVRNLVSINLYRAAMAAVGYSDPAFTAYANSVDFADFAARESQVKAVSLESEILAGLRAIAPTIYGGTERIVPIGTQTLLDATGLAYAEARTELHSMTLLTSMLRSTAFAQAVQNSPQSLALFFDSRLYKFDPETSSFANFLDKLLIADMGDAGTGRAAQPILDRFAADLQKLTTTDGTAAQSAMEKALTVATMEYYYFKDPGTTTALFTADGNGIHFKYSDIGASSYKSLPLLVRAIETLLGPAQSFQTGIYGRLITQDAWHLQSGSGGMTWTATGADNDAAIGGDQEDDLNAGAGNDVLLGLGGNDTLTGGGGNDLLIGGDGNDILNGGYGDDTYIIEGNDTILDTDGKGRIKDKAGNVIAGFIEKRQNGSYAFLGDSTINVTKDVNLKLTLADGNSITINNFTDGNLGLSLIDAEATFPLRVEGTNADEMIAFGFAAAGIAFGGVGQDIISASNGNDNIFAEYEIDLGSLTSYANFGGAWATGQKGDWLTGGLGKDSIVGNIGNDVLLGGGGRDLILGGAGDDLLNGDDHYVPTEYPVSLLLEGNVVTNVLNFTPDFNWYVIPTPNSFQAQFSSVSVITNARDVGDADVMFGGAGNDSIVGMEGDDQLFGEDGDDTISGGDGADIIYGGTGNDRLTGEFNGELYGDGFSVRVGGNDYINGGDGDDWIQGEDGDDVLLGGAGNDFVWGDRNNLLAATSGDDYLDGGEGDDQLIGGGRNDTLLGGAGYDKLYGDSSDQQVAGNDYLDGGADDDILIGMGGSDTLIGGTGNDQLAGDSNDTAISAQGDDYLDGGEGNDTLDGGGGADTLIGGAGNDTLSGDGAAPAGALHGNDFLDGGSGDDILIGMGGSDTLIGGIGNDQLAGDSDDTETSVHGDDYLDGGAGNDLLVGHGGADTLMGGNGNDELQGGDGNDKLDAGANDDKLFGGNGDDVLSGGTGIDFLYGQMGNDVLYGEGGNDELQGGDGQDILSGGADNDRLLGGNDDDVLIGNEGDDELQGANGIDTLMGGEGVDMLFGQAGDDALYGEDGNDELQGGDGNDTLVGGAGVDLLFGDGGDDVLQGDAGNDELRGGNDQDTLSGGTGADLLFGQAGDDVLYGEEDNDQLQGGDGNDELFGGTGDDRLYGDAGNDTLDGGAGTDTLFGGLGNNTYLYARGQGADVIIENNATLGKISKLKFAADILSSAIEMQRTSEGGDSLVLTLKDNSGLATGDRVLLVNYFSGTTNVTRVETIEFVDAAWTLTNVQAKLNLPTGGNDILVGLDYADVLYGLAGNDVINGHGGDDVLQGGDGNDVLSGGAGNDTLYGQDGDDSLEGSVGNDTLLGDAGNDVYLFAAGDGQDTLIETGGNADVLRFKAGIIPQQVKVIRNDWTVVGEDSLVLQLLDENGVATADSVYIRAYFNDDNDARRVDRIEFADGVVWTYADIQAMQPVATESNDFSLIGFAGADVIDGLGGNDNIYGRGGDDSLLGGDGNDYLYGQSGNDTLNGGVGNDNVQGGLGNDTLLGGAGNDRLLGYDTIDSASEMGNDVLYGGAGNDLMFGGSGDDIYLFGRGDGYDKIGDDPNVSGPSQDILRLGAGVLPTQVTLYRTSDRIGSGDELVVVIDNSGTQVVIENYFASEDRQIERIEFDNGAGAVWTAADIAARVNAGTTNAMVGTASNDVFVVDNEWDTITEAVDAGIDTVNASRTFTLSANIENLTLTGPLNINGTGNELDNILRGNSSNNLLDGGPALNPGIDIAYGGLGDDIYRNIETIVENPGEGIDTWETNFGGTLPDNVENLSPTSGGYSSYKVWAVGNALDNTLISTGILDGRTGADTMIAAGNGSVVFYVDNVGDKVIASSSGGSADEVRSYITYTLGSYVENLTLLDAAPISGYGNDLNNVLDASQNFAANFLAGGKGNDTYLLGAGDTVSELANEGIDTIEIQSGTANVYDLSQYLNIENLTLSDGVVVNATVLGNDQDNILRGNIYSTNLWGGAGNDRVYGKDGGDILHGNAGNDYIAGNGGNDILDGGEGNDILSGDGGSDVYIFNAGHGYDRVRNYDAGTSKQDTIRFGYSPYELSILRQGDSLSLDNLVFQNVNGQDSVTVEYWYSNPAAKIDRVEFADGSAYSLQDALGGTSGADNILGTNIDSVIMTGAGDDTLDGAGGNDLLNGGIGNDIYLFGKAGGQDVIYDYDAAPGNIDTVKMVTGVLSGEVQFTRIGSTSSDLVISIVGTADKVTVKNWFTADTYRIEKIEFVDGTIWDAATIESKIVIANPPTEGADILFGTVGDDVINALGGNDTVSGGAGNDILDGGTGADSLFGNSGDDLYGVDNVGDVATELVGEGADTVQSTITYTLGAHLENLTLMGVDAINGTGNELNNILVGNAAANILDGAAGTDTLQGGAGDDTYVMDNVGDVVTENLAEGVDTVQSSITYTLTANLENLTLIGTAAINGTGNELNNILVGNAAANILDGAAGADTMQGGAGDDTYVRDNAADVITELANGGIDTVQTGLTYTLATNLENLTLTGATAINGTGNTLDNVLVGNGAINTLTGGAGNDTLNGGAGADKLTGGTGNDMYLVENIGDVLTELANEGTDTVQSSVTYSLGANIENLTLTGASAINGTGNTLNNILLGNSAANTLSGGTGADQMMGGSGNDAYVVDNTGDVITELANEGIDSVQSSVTYTLAVNVENLTLTGTAATNGTGNMLDNVLVGNGAINTLTGGAGNDTLNGGAGADKLTGGAGDDIYIRDNTSDVVTELANEGTDTVQSSVTYTLAANVENLTLTGTTAINGTGNALDNVLIGNSAINTLTGGVGNDTLNGGAGADKLTGGAGNDTYLRDNTGDVVTELANEGIDTVQSSVTYALGANVENLTLTGTAAINGIGNALNNVLTGNSAANTLTGGAGNDTYLFGRDAGQDVVSNLDTASTDDKVVFGATIATDQLWFTRDVNNLRVSIIGTADQVTVQNWYLGSNYTVNKFQTANGSVLLESQVEQLRNAMASMVPPPAGQLTLTPEQQTALNPVLTASWQSAA